MVSSDFWASLGTGLLQGGATGFQMGTIANERRADQERQDQRDLRAHERDMLQLRQQAARMRGVADLDPLWTAREKIGGDRRSVAFARERFYTPAGGDPAKAAELARAEEVTIRGRLQGILGPEKASLLDDATMDGELNAQALIDSLMGGGNGEEARAIARQIRLDFDALRSTRESSAMFDFLRYNPVGSGDYDPMAEISAFDQRWGGGGGGVENAVGSTSTAVSAEPRMPQQQAGGQAVPQLWSNDLGALAAGTPPSARGSQYNPAPPMPAFRQPDTSVMGLAEQARMEGERAPLGPEATPEDSLRAGEIAMWYTIAMNPQAPMPQQAAAWTKLSKLAPIQVPVEFQLWASGAGISEEDLLEGAQGIEADMRFDPRDPMSDRGAGPAGMAPPGRPLPGRAQGPASPDVHGQARGGAYMPPAGGAPPATYSYPREGGPPRRGFAVDRAPPQGFAAMDPQQAQDLRSSTIADSPEGYRQTSRGAPASPSWDDRWRQLWTEATRVLGREPTEDEMLQWMMATDQR